MCGFYFRASRQPSMETYFELTSEDGHLLNEDLFQGCHCCVNIDIKDRIHQKTWRLSWNSFQKYNLQGLTLRIKRYRQSHEQHTKCCSIMHQQWPHTMYSLYNTSEMCNKELNHEELVAIIRDKLRVEKNHYDRKIIIFETKESFVEELILPLDRFNWYHLVLDNQISEVIIL